MSKAGHINLCFCPLVGTLQLDLLITDSVNAISLTVLCVLFYLHTQILKVTATCLQPEHPNKNNDCLIINSLAIGYCFSKKSQQQH